MELGFSINHCLMCSRRPRFHSYPALYPELKGEVRSRCMPSALSMLAMTCHQEYDAAGEHARQDLYLRLAADGNLMLLKRGLSSPFFKSIHLTYGMHDIKHAALQTGHAHVAEWLFRDPLGLSEWKCCTKCIELMIQSRCYATLLEDWVIQYDSESYHEESACHVAITEAILANDVSALTWLQDHMSPCMDAVFTSTYFRRLPSVKSRRLTQCNAALEWMESHYPGSTLGIRLILYRYEGRIHEQCTPNELMQLYPLDRLPFTTDSLGHALLYDAFLRYALDARNEAILDAMHGWALQDRRHGMYNYRWANAKAFFERMDNEELAEPLVVRQMKQWGITLHDN